MAQNKIRAIPAPEKERRWKQHVTSEGGSGQVRRRARRPTRVRGSGDYFTDFQGSMRKHVPKGALASGGSKIGRFLGGLISPGLASGGEVAGHHVGDKLARLVGWGDYDLKYNSLLDPAAAKAVAQGSGFGERGSNVVISHRENLGTLMIPALAEGVKASPFKETRYRIQPTNKVLFPWLAGVANNYVEYEIHGLIFSFETTCSPYSISMGLGTVAFATQHNANSVPYGSMKTILNVENKATGHPAEDIVHGVECDPSMQTDNAVSQYVRRAGDRGPPNLYDFGQLTIATEGLPEAAANVALGQLFVTYQIRFRSAELPPTTEIDGKILCVRGNYTGQPANTPPLGHSLNLVKQDSLKSTPDYLMLDVGSSGNHAVQLLMPKAGHYNFPDLVDAFQDMMFWISDDNASACMQHLGFRYEGYYDICIVCSSSDADITWAHKEPVIHGESGSLTYTVGAIEFIGPGASVYGTHTSWYKVFIAEPGQSVSIALPEIPSTAEQTYQTTMMVVKGTEFDVSLPPVSGHPMLSRADRRQEKMNALLQEQRAYDAARQADRRVSSLQLGPLDSEWVDAPCDETSSEASLQRAPSNVSSKAVHFGPCA